MPALFAPPPFPPTPFTRSHPSQPWLTNGQVGRRTTSTVSELHLVDLAGSERALKTGATGARLREACLINTQLTALGVVINKLAAQEKYIPYRQSKLTWLLSPSLGGRNRCAMIATLSPCHESYQENVATLNFAMRAKAVVNRAEKVGAGLRCDWGPSSCALWADDDGVISHWIALACLVLRTRPGDAHTTGGGSSAPNTLICDLPPRFHP